MDVQLRVFTYPPAPTQITCAEAATTRIAGDQIEPSLRPMFLPKAASTSPPIVDALAQMNAPQPIDLTFDLTADGRPHALRPSGAVSPFALAQNEFVGAMIVGTWRFNPGRPLTACRVHLDGAVVQVGEASREQLLEAIGSLAGPSTYGAANPAQVATLATLNLSTDGNASAKAAIDTFRDRYLPPGADCDRQPELQPRLLAFPDPDAAGVAPGRRAWSIVSYDVDASGATRNARLEASSGDADLDRQATDAVARSEFDRIPRKGCMAVFRQVGPVLAWPGEHPPVAATVGCPTDARFIDADISRLFPSAYRQRHIEGWALVQFDVAPWGEIGALQAIKSEPTSDFGQAAINVVRAGKLEPSSQGARGCLMPVTFKFPKGTGAEGRAALTGAAP
jgi:TonB family protein